MEAFKDLLSERAITIINPVWDSFKKEKIIGWHLTAPSVIRLPASIKFVKKIIKENNLDWYIEEVDYTNQFFVYAKDV